MLISSASLRYRLSSSHFLYVACLRRQRSKANSSQCHCHQQYSKMAKTNTQKWSIAIPKANHSLQVIMLIDNHDPMESVNNIVNFWTMWKWL
jgi:hypothetical protein